MNLLEFGWSELILGVALVYLELIFESELILEEETMTSQSSRFALGPFGLALQPPAGARSPSTFRAS
jgi:hypothetical protein